MALMKLPVTGDGIDPEVAKIGAVFVAKPVPGQDATFKVVILANVAGIGQVFIQDCKTEAEAETMRDALMVRFGYVDPAVAEAAGQTRQ